MRRFVVRVVPALVLAAVLTLLGSTARAGPPSASYVPPVDAPVIDPFRPPPTPYAPGNRGLEYGTAPGDPVHASADGVVLFAGQVGGTLHVTLRHADGLRTSYSFLATITVSPTTRVHQGDVIGTAAGAFHFGVRDPNDVYLDPQLLFVGRLRAEVHLVRGPDDGDGQPETRVHEVAGLRAIVNDRLANALAFSRQIAGDVDAALRVRVQAAVNVTTPAHLLSIARSMQGWYLQRSQCTPAARPAPRFVGRRVIVLVAGIGSTSEHAAIDELDTAALGYAASDVVRFSYRGGSQPYTAADTQQDLARSAERLRALLADVAASHPGVPIDVVAHSQGGVVARLALESGDPPAAVRTLVTLATPHHGANLASAVRAARLDPQLGASLRAAFREGRLDLDPDSAAVAQLAETSSTVDDVNRRPFPSSVRLVSIAARGDLTVPSPRTIVGDGSTSTVVAVDGLHAHDQLPASPAARREIALAIAGLPPTCRSFGAALGQALYAETIDAVEDDLTAAAAWAPVLLAPPG